MRDYNFFESCQRRNDIHVNLKSPVFLGLVVILLILVASAGLVVQNTMIKAKVTKATETLNALQSSAEYQEAVQIQESITALTEYDQYASNALSRIESGKILSTGFLTALSAAVPSTVSLQSANVTTANAAFYFQVPDQATAAELVYDLDHSGLFLQTTLVSVTSGGSAGGFTAAVNCILKAGEKQ